MRQLITLIMLVLAGCASSTVVSETMLPDGVTWDIRVRQLFSSKLEELKECYNTPREPSEKSENMSKCEYQVIEASLRAALRTHSIELCGRKPHRLFVCSSNINFGDSSFSCYAECAQKYPTTADRAEDPAK